MRKPRPDAKLHHLSLEQQRELAEWLLGGMSYQAARDQVAKEFDLETSTGALHDFYHAFCVPELLRRRREAVTTAEDIARDVAESPGRWDEAATDALKQRVFELMLVPSSSPKDVKQLFDLVLRAQKQEIERDKLTAATKDKITAGLDALYEEIKGNEAAVEIFNQLKEVVAAS